MNTCPHCGQTIRAARKAKPTEVSGPIDTSKLSTDALFAYHKATAPNLDAEFFVTHARGLTADEQVELAALATDKATNRRDHYRRLIAVQDAWRRRKDSAVDAAFAQMRARFAVAAEIQQFKRKRSELLELITGRSSYSKYELDRVYSLVRSTVSLARSCYPRVFAHENTDNERAV